MKKVESYIFGGVNAVGKTHLFTALHRERPDVQPVHAAGLLMEWLGITPGDYDTLRSLSPDHKNQETANAVRERIAQADTGTVLLFDYHYLNLIDGKTSPTVEGDWLRETDGLILVEAAPATIHRRIRNEARDRRLFPQCAGITEVDEAAILAGFVHETREEFQRQVAINNVPGLVVSNETTDLDAAVRNILLFQGSISTAARPAIV